MHQRTSFICDFIFSESYHVTLNDFKTQVVWMTFLKFDSPRSLLVWKREGVKILQNVFLCLKTADRLFIFSLNLLKHAFDMQLHLMDAFNHWALNVNMTHYGIFWKEFSLCTFTCCTNIVGVEPECYYPSQVHVIMTRGKGKRGIWSCGGI